MDRARARTDKMLNSIEKDISRMYRMHPALLSVEKEYRKYMESIYKRVEGSYRDFIDEKDKDIQKEKKEAYMSEIRRYTIESKEYNRLVKKIVAVLAEVNQQALDMVNVKMPDIYAMNYNQVAEDCKKVGIEVNG